MFILKRRVVKICSKYGIPLSNVFTKVLAFKETNDITPEFVKTILCGIEDKDAKVLCKYIYKSILD